MKLFLFLSLYTSINFGQKIPISKDTLNNVNFLTPVKKQYVQDENNFKALKNAIISSPLIKGYQYSIPFHQIDDLLLIKQINTFLKFPSTSFFNSSLLKNNATNIQLRGYANLNGIAQVITFKGGFFNQYNGNYTLQISYRLSPTDYNINIPNLVKQEVQNGLALKLKINLENSKKK